MAFRMYLQRPEAATAMRERFAGVHDTLLHKYRVDEFYAATVVRPLMGLANGFWKFWDVKIVDGAVNGAAYVLEFASALMRLPQNGFVGTYALALTIGVAALLLHFLRH